MSTVWTSEDEKRFKELDARRTALMSAAIHAVCTLHEKFEKGERYGSYGLECLTEHADDVVAALAPFSKKAIAQREEAERELRISQAVAATEGLSRQSRVKRFDRIRLAKTFSGGYEVQFLLGDVHVAALYDAAFQDRLEFAIEGDARIDLSRAL